MDSVLEALLPAVLVPDATTSVDKNIYSLFEACHGCEKMPWLQNKKEFFMFRLLDSQYTFDCKYKVPDSYGNNPKGFMSQQTLEQMKLPNSFNYKNLKTAAQAAGTDESLRHFIKWAFRKQSFECKFIKLEVSDLR